MKGSHLLLLLALVGGAAAGAAWWTGRLPIGAKATRGTEEALPPGPPG
ncbi:MAG: hypothetical protein GX458_19175, partial [Phyllobacteriaceae bacterium]|nr:hypothetical protein [Phyllobacteriaceae bacterium]